MATIQHVCRPNSEKLNRNCGTKPTQRLVL
jgi:hypothetical protein